MRASRVAATFWAERQVRAGGRSKEEADLPATGDTERERKRETDRLNSSSAQYSYDSLIPREQMINFLKTNKLS